MRNVKYNIRHRPPVALLPNCSLLALAYVLMQVLLLSSCEHDIDIDYHEAAPRYVVEASVTDEMTRVNITMTHPMTGDYNPTYVDNALVVISSDDGRRDTALYGNKGNYLAGMYGTVGRQYRLEVSVDGQHFTSTSVMQRKPELDSCRMVWKEMMSLKLLFLDVYIKDFPDEENYYYVHVYRNGFSYRWTAIRDTGNPGKRLQQLFSCCSDENLNKADSRVSDTDVMCEGDKISIELRTIDRRAYDYLVSMEQIGSTGTNPIANFEGGCLGYFSAYSQLTYEFVFHENDVETEIN